MAEMSVIYDITHRNVEELERELLFKEVMRLRRIALEQAQLLDQIETELEELTADCAASPKSSASRVESVRSHIKNCLKGRFDKATLE